MKSFDLQHYFENFKLLSLNDIFKMNKRKEMNPVKYTLFFQNRLVHVPVH